MKDVDSRRFFRPPRIRESDFRLQGRIEFRERVLFLAVRRNIIGEIEFNR